MQLQILSTLTASQLVMNDKIWSFSSKINGYLETPPDCPYSSYARAMFISSLCPHINKIPSNALELFKKSAADVIDKFITTYDKDQAPFITSIVSTINVPDEKRSVTFQKFLEFSANDTMHSAYLIPAALSVSSGSDDEISLLLSSILPSISVLPFHFSVSLPDDAAVSSFNVAVRTIHTIMNSGHTEQAMCFLLNAAQSGPKEQRLGSQYALTCLFKIGAPIDASKLTPLFSKISNSLEAGTISELALAVISNGGTIMEWRQMLDVFEQCYLMASDISIQFSIDAATSLGRTVKEPSSVVLKVIADKISTRFQFAAIHLGFLNSFCEQDFPKEFPPELIMHLILFSSMNSKLILPTLEAHISHLGDDPYSVVDSLNPETHSPVARAMLAKFQADKEAAVSICRFLIRLSSHSPQAIAIANISAVTDYLQANLEENLPLVSAAFASLYFVSPESAVHAVTALISSLTKGWFIFASTVKPSLVIKMVFLVLSMIKENSTSFLQLASEHLPDISDTELTKSVLNILANTFRSNPQLDYEFPPKCRLFDFVTSVKEVDDDVFRCVGHLLIIPPICHAEHIPLVSTLALKTTTVSSDLLFMLKAALQICQGPGDVQLLIEPFVANLHDEHAYSMLLSVLQSLSGETTQQEDFSSIGFDSSSRLDAPGQSYDGFLTLLARTVGISIPNFDRTHVAVYYILKIMGHLTQKMEVKQQLSLHEAMKYIASTFNSQCLFNAASLLAENQTIAAVTAFLILFKERESELLHCVQQFIANLLRDKNPNTALVFDANETLAKAAASMVTVEHFELLKTSLKASRYQKQIVDVLKEFLVEKASLVRKIAADPELSMVNISSPEAQFVTILNDANYDTDLSSFPKETVIGILEILKMNITKLEEDQQLAFAKIIANVSEEECITMAIDIFDPYFRGSSGVEFMTCFATSLRVLPVLLKVCESNQVRLFTIVSLALKNPGALALISPILPQVIASLLKYHDSIVLLLKQEKIELLKNVVPLMLVALLPAQPEDAALITKLIMKATGVTGLKPPTTFVALLQLCQSLKLSTVDNVMQEQLLKRAQKGTKISSLSSLVVLSHLCHCGIVEKELQLTTCGIVKNLFANQDEVVHSAALTCVACFSVLLFT